MKLRKFSLLFVITIAALATNAPAPGPYKGCQAKGDGGDTILNALKNRSDVPGVPKEITIAQILQLPQSTQVGNSNPRQLWTAENLHLVAQFEQTAVVVEGFLRRVKQESLEHCNCERQDLNDFHMWIIEQASDPPTRSVVVEATPRWRGANPNWNLHAFQHLVSQHARVRIAGWLMFDQEHPEQLKPAQNRPATRGTLWEVHPVTKIEVLSGGSWREL